MAVSSIPTGVQNGQETDVDCGGPDCPQCAISRSCAVSEDCAGATSFCKGGSVCALELPTCNDARKNGAETDIDW